MTKILTIDGPSAVGKGTISGYLSDELKWNYLNSGALYRAIAWVAIKDSIEINNILEIKKAISILGKKNLYILHANSEYPTKNLKDINLNVIKIDRIIKKVVQFSRGLKN